MGKDGELPDSLIRSSDQTSTVGCAKEPLVEPADRTPNPRRS
ncbi:MAG: hypothetical protein ACR2LA_10440 [Acidimicrobiales bacterium]